jgi:UDP-N-acetylglucosamine--N-acetylmuramyl-(pentapeptide) pyrophosphoryl-undecaprenol N-acetylglucosamine transferase
MLTSHSLLFVGGVGGMERAWVARAGLPFSAIHGGGVHGVGWRLPLNTLHLLRGLFDALRLVRAHRPEALLVTGGFITVPTALAAWLSRVPVLIYLPDIEPALAVRAISRLARRIAVTVAESRRYFPGRAGDVLVTGYPVRPELLALAQDPQARAAARQHFGLQPDRPVVLVTGGSRGARSLNRAVAAALPGWLQDYAVIHLSGELDWAEVERAQAALPAEARAHYRAFPFLHEMGLALAAADLVVSRAGASALGEYPLFGLPAILVPYPHAWRYQRVNAQALVERGAAVQIDDEALPARLAGEVRALLADPARLAAMRAAARAAATPDAAARVARALLQLAGAARDETLP